MIIISIRQSNHAVIGGTFDKLHQGHTLLIKTACTVAKTVSIGLTSSFYLEKYPKKFKEKIYPYEYRLEQLTKFIITLNPNFNFYIFPINHPWDNFSIRNADLDCIVVSQETLQSAQKINSERKEKNLSELKIILIAGVLSEINGSYVSSTKIRSQL